MTEILDMPNTLRETVLRRLARRAASGCGAPKPLTAKKGKSCGSDTGVNVKVAKAAEDVSDVRKLKQVPSTPGGARSRPYI